MGTAPKSLVPDPEPDHRCGLGDSLKPRSLACACADAMLVELCFTRLRAHATAILLAASAALAAAGASAPPTDHHALAVPLFSCAAAGVCAVVTWCWGVEFGDLAVAALVVIVTLLVTLTAAASDASATSDVLLFLLPVVFAGCFLPARLAVCALLVCVGAYGWLVGRDAPGAAGIFSWISAALVLASATATVALLRRELTGTMVELASLARCDPLTGLLNRRSFDEALANELERSLRTGASCAVMMCDLDSFKAINDEHGHATGDALLERVASDLLAGVRAIDTVARIGGEEFALLLIDCETAAAARVAERLRRRVGAKHEGSPDVTISVGVADSSLAISAPELLAHADRALYDAKEKGRNRVHSAASPAEQSFGLAA